MRAATGRALTGSRPARFDDDQCSRSVGCGAHADSAADSCQPLRASPKREPAAVADRLDLGDGQAIVVNRYPDQPLWILHPNAYRGGLRLPDEAGEGFLYDVAGPPHRAWPQCPGAMLF